MKKSACILFIFALLPAACQLIVEPVIQKNRILKKPFGIFVEDRFRGYHTGTDFEILPGEENWEIAFFAICDGPLRLKKTASGYGGVLVQKCTIDGKTATVIYGHVRLRSVEKNSGDWIISGEKIGLLGTDKSSETGGERRHLHLGIHKGESMELRGYVNAPEQLEFWMNPENYIRDLPNILSPNNISRKTL